MDKRNAAARSQSTSDKKKKDMRGQQRNEKSFEGRSRCSMAHLANPEEQVQWQSHEAKSGARPKLYEGTDSCIVRANLPNEAKDRAEKERETRWERQRLGILSRRRCDFRYCGALEVCSRGTGAVFGTGYGLCETLSSQLTICGEPFFFLSSSSEKERERETSCLLFYSITRHTRTTLNPCLLAPPLLIWIGLATNLKLEKEKA